MNGQDGAHDDCSVVVTGIGPVFLFDDLLVMCTNMFRSAMVGTNKNQYSVMTAAMDSK